MSSRSLRSIHRTIAGLTGIWLVLVSGQVLSSGNRTVQVQVTNIEQLAGEVGIVVFGSKESFDSRTDPLAEIFVPVVHSPVVADLEIRSADSFAVIVFQDLNGDREIDMNGIGIPLEPYGFSNNARAAFGPPPFRRARIDSAEEQVSVEIALR